MIVILGDSNYPHIQNVTEHLKADGEEYLVLDLNSDTEYSLEVDEIGQKSLYYQKYNLDSVKIAWRSNKEFFSDFGSDEIWANEYMCGMAIKDTYKNLCCILPCPIVNDTPSVMACGNKLYQLAVAQSYGIRTPQYLITNSINEIVQWASGEKIVIKAIGRSQIPRYKDGAIYPSLINTMLANEDYLQVNMGNIEPLPIHVQKLINKKYEYRCIVVAGKIFTLKIDPFKHPIMEIDYRLGGRIIDYVPWNLPSDIERILVKLIDAFNLFSGCIDLIEDVNGDYYFLEVNPEGVWGLHDEIYDQKISRAFADALLGISCKRQRVNIHSI